MTEIYEAGRRNGKTVETIAEAVREAVGKGIDVGVIKAPTLTPIYVGMDSAINPIYKVKADGFATGGLIPKPKPEVRFWEDAKIYRNGLDTVVIWKDGSKTHVKCQEDDDLDDLRAFEEALAKRLYGSRTALKKFAKKNTIDIAKKRQKKATKKETRKTYSLREFTDKEGQSVHIGDTVFINAEAGLLPEFGMVELAALYHLNGTIITVTGIGESGVKTKELCNAEIPFKAVTKIKTEPPFKIGDWVAITPPKEGENTFGFTLDYIRELAKKPFEVLGVRADDVLEVNHVVDNEERTIYIKKDWVRKA